MLAIKYFLIYAFGANEKLKILLAAQIMLCHHINRFIPEAYLVYNYMRCLRDMPHLNIVKRDISFKRMQRRDIPPASSHTGYNIIDITYL